MNPNELRALRALTPAQLAAYLAPLPLAQQIILGELYAAELHVGAELGHPADRPAPPIAAPLQGLTPETADCLARAMRR